MLAIVVPWYAALYQRYGWTYIMSFLVGENVARYTEGLGVEQRRGPSFYLPVVFSDSFPWSLFLVWRGWALAGGLADAQEERNRVERSRLRIRTLLWLWIVVIVGLLLVFGREAGPLHLSDRAGGRRARRASSLRAGTPVSPHRGLGRSARRPR